MMVDDDARFTRGIPRERLKRRGEIAADRFRRRKIGKDRKEVVGIGRRVALKPSEEREIERSVSARALPSSAVASIEMQRD